MDDLEIVHTGVSSGMAKNDTLIQIRISTDLKHDAQKCADAEGVKLAEFIRKAMEDRVARLRGEAHMDALIRYGGREIPLNDLFKQTIIIQPSRNGRAAKRVMKRAPAKKGRAKK